MQPCASFMSPVQYCNVFQFQHEAVWPHTAYLHVILSEKSVLKTHDVIPPVIYSSTFDFFFL